MKNKEINARIEQLRIFKGFSKEKMCELLKIKAANKLNYYSAIINANKPLSTDKLKLLVEGIPDLNLNWLFYGFGSPVRSKEENKTHTQYARIQDLEDWIRKTEKRIKKLEEKCK